MTKFLMLIFVSIISLTPIVTQAAIDIKLAERFYVVGATSPPPVQMEVTITGPIERKDTATLVDYYKELTEPQKSSHPLLVRCHDCAGRTHVNIVIDSTGGDADAALEIGKFLLALGHFGKVSVRANGQCLSACVFILAGAQTRYVSPGAKVGIHRPYLRNAIQTDPIKMKALYEKLTEQLRDFFEKAGIDTKLADQMMRIPPEKVLILSRDQLNSYGLAESNVAIQETMAMREALDLKISREELAKRKAYADRICRYDDCESIRTKTGMTEACMRYTMCIINAKKNPVPDQ